MIWNHLCMCEWKQTWMRGCQLNQYFVHPKVQSGKKKPHGRPVKDRRWFGTNSIDLWRAIWAWPGWLNSVIEHEDECGQTKERMALPKKGIESSSGSIIIYMSYYRWPLKGESNNFTMRPFTSYILRHFIW